MKATGIVRRIDDLGRVVIPKEIRRTQRIREGDPLEIFTTGSGEVIFKKYSPIGELTDLATHYAEALYKNMGSTALICDRDAVIAAAGPGKKECIDKPVSIPLEKMMEARKPYANASNGEECLFACEGTNKHILMGNPILAGGDVVGAVLLLTEEKSRSTTPEEQKAVNIAAAFLGLQMET